KLDPPSAAAGVGATPRSAVVRMMAAVTTEASRGAMGWGTRGTPGWVGLRSASTLRRDRRSHDGPMVCSEVVRWVQWRSGLQGPMEECGHLLPRDDGARAVAIGVAAPGDPRLRKPVDVGLVRARPVIGEPVARRGRKLER